MIVSKNLNFSVLIATKNRPTELALLLDSITKSTILPSRVVIVFAGIDINQIVSDYSSKLNLSLIHI